MRAVIIAVQMSTPKVPHTHVVARAFLIMRVRKKRLDKGRA
jgi:hypothetical protein